MLVGAASNGLYQKQYFQENGPALIFWVLVGVVGVIMLILKNHRLQEHKLLDAFIDLCFVLPTILIPLIPVRHDLALISMLIYASIFLIVFVYKHYKRN